MKRLVLAIFFLCLRKQGKMPLMGFASGTGVLAPHCIDATNIRTFFTAKNISII